MFSSAGFFSSMMRHGQPVQEEDYVSPPGGLVLLDGELIDGEPVVVVGVFEVDDCSGFPAHGPVVSPDRHGHAPGEGVVKGAVPGFQGRPIGVDQMVLSPVSSAEAGRPGFRLNRASLSRSSRTTWVKSARSAPGVSGAMPGP